MTYRRLLFIPLFLAGMAAVAQAQLDPLMSNRQVHIRNERLYRGSSPEVVRGVHMPELGKPGATIDEIAFPLNEMSKWGANAFTFDLTGVSADGFGEDGVASLRTLYGEFDWRRIVGICRVLSEDGPEGAEAREAAAILAAKGILRALGPVESTELIYWFDGPHAGAAAKAFKATAPLLTVLAPEGGDLTAVKSVKQAQGNPLAVAVGARPKAIDTETHFILPATKAAYKALDVTLAHPLEMTDWTPDNSILTEEQRADGWLALFDGKTLNGWIVTGQQDAWAVEDGEIHWVHRGGGYILTKRRFDDFQLHVEWRIAEGDNSGLFIRAPRENRQSKIGLEIQLFGDHGRAPHKNGSGALYDVLPPTENATKPAGEWNVTEVTANGSHIKVVMNGVTVHDLDMADHPELNRRIRDGFIGLQDHSGDVAFRNIWIKPL